MYKYSLDRSSRKYICPSCGKKTLVRYVDNQTGDYLSEAVGRCDRESKCQYHLKPNGNTPLVDVSTIQKTVVEPTYVDPSIVRSSLQEPQSNHFISFLEQFFSKEEIDKAVNKYLIGTNKHWNGATVFWQIDEYNKVRTGKVMLYDMYTGNRVKKPFTHISWIHKVYRLNDFVLQQCLFGIHNLKHHKKTDIVCIVESEKTAIVMSILFPDQLWLATGSKSNFKENLLKPIKGFKVIAYPDNSEYEDWEKVAQNLNKKGYNLKCSSFIEQKSNEEGVDLVDLLMS